MSDGSSRATNPRTCSRNRLSSTDSRRSIERPGSPARKSGFALLEERLLALAKVVADIGLQHLFAVADQGLVQALEGKFPQLPLHHAQRARRTGLRQIVCVGIGGLGELFARMDLVDEAEP